MATLSIARNGHRQTTFENLKGLRAEGYVRDSTLDQRDGFGPELQRRAIQTFAQNYHLLLGPAWYTDFVTGTSTLKRSGFQQVIQDAQVDRFDVLLCYHTSRFARNRADAIRYKEELRKRGKVVVFVSQGIISGNDNDFLNEGINEVLDEHYSRNLARWVADGLRVKAAEGYALGNAPLGFRHGPRPTGRGVWTVPDERTMPALLALLRGYATGEHSFRTLAQSLNAQGYRTAEGRPFTESSVNTALNTPFYSGKVRYHRGRPDEEVREGVHPVPEEVKALWRQCQEVRREKRRPGQPSPRSRQHQVYPLTGVLVCDGCGEPFHGVLDRPRRGGAYRRMWHSDRRCGARPWSLPAPRVEGEFAEWVLACLHLDNGWREAVLKALAQEGSLPDHALELRRIEAALANLRKQHLWGAITDEEFKAEFQALDRQRMAVAPPPQAVELPNLERAAQLLQDLPALWQHPGVSPEQRRELAHEVFQELRLREGRLVAALPRSQYAPLFAYSLWRQYDVGGKRSS